MAILNFMVFFPGKEKKPTAFCDKIWQGFINLNPENIHEFMDFKSSFRNRFSGTKIFQNWDRHDSPLYNMKFWPKLHTIREDKTNRWKAGMMIDFFINARTKNMFRFAPRVPVISIQKINIYRRDDLPASLHIGEKYIVDFPFEGEIYQLVYMIKIDDKWLSYDQIKELAKNDGFDTPEDFFAWFNKDFSGKIIHWTDLKY